LGFYELFFPIAGNMVTGEENDDWHLIW
jgi:hypothetical protein